jgi:hypothetical protein
MKRRNIAALCLAAALAVGACSGDPTGLPMPLESEILQNVNTMGTGT